MNRMQQIHVGLLASLLVAACLATEHRQYYEILHEQGNIFQVEDYHADLVLGMLPNIKTSIKDFRKRNFTSNDIENMYQTLTIFWPVVRKYLHLKEEFVDEVPSEGKMKYEQHPNSSSSENGEIPIKENVGLHNVQTRSKIVQSQISHSSPLVIKRDKPTPSAIHLNSTPTNENRGLAYNPKTPISTSPKNKQNNNGRKYVARFKSIRESSPKSDDNRTEMNKPQKSVSTPSKNNQNTNRKNLVKMKGIREPSSMGDDTISIQSNFQSARTTIPKNNRVNGSPYKFTSNKSVLTNTGRPSRQPSKLISSDLISTTEETPYKSTSDKTFSYTTRRPYRKTYKLLSQDTLSTAVKRLLQSSAATFPKNSSANLRPYKTIRNKPFSTTTRRPSKLIGQGYTSTTEKTPISTTIYNRVPSSTNARRPARGPSQLSSQGSLSTQDNRPFESAYHQLLRSSASRLLQTAIHNLATDNASTSSRTAGRSISTTKSTPVPNPSIRSNPIRATGRSISTSISTPVPSSSAVISNPLRTDGRSIPTTISIPVPASSAVRSNPTRTDGRSTPTTKSIPVPTSSAFRSNPTRTEGRSTPITISTPLAASTISRPIPKSPRKIIRSKPTRTEDRSISIPISTPVPASTNKTPIETLKQPINEDTFYYTDISSIMQALGRPIDLTNFGG